jgi:UDP-2,3-diacylglucosamine pyrophosphatase LpxH
MSLFLSAATLLEMRMDSYSADYLLPCILGIFIGLVAGSLPMLFGSRAASYGWRMGNNARPDASRPLLVVADPHWRIDLTGLHEATLAEPDADWLFLGDVFNIWMGLKGFETDAQRNFLWWVSERRRTGHWIGLWLGNREYFLDGIADKFDFIGEGTEGRLFTEPFVFEHGDLINTKDWKYRFWNLFSRSMPVWAFAKITPPIIGAKLCSWLEKKLKATNEENKIGFPMEEFQKAIDAAGAEYFIVGHFHCLEEADKGLSIPWAHEGQMMLWQNGEFRLVGNPIAQSDE